MTSFWRLLGEELRLICEGKFDLGSSCSQRAIIDALNILFLLAIFISLLVCSVTKKNTAAKWGRRDWAVLATSICSALSSAAYFGAGFLDLIAKTSGFLYFVRGVIWISLTASLLVKRPKWVVILVSVWWVLFFVLISALNITVLARKLQFQILDILTWPVNFLLLFCAVSNFYSFFCGDEIYKYLSEPLLLDEEPEKKRSRTSHPSFFSKLTFSWINPLLRLGYSKILALEDIPCLGPEDEAAVAYEKFRQAWEGLLERKEKRSSDSKNLVFKALGKVYMKELVLTGTYALLKSLCVVVAPLLLYGFVNYSNEESSRKVEDGLVLVGCLAAVKVVESLSQRHFYFNSRRTGMRMRSALMVAIYKKQLNLSSLGRRRHSTGEIVNYIAVDAYRMGEFPTWFHMAWTLSAQLFLAVGVLFGIMGYGALPGLVPLIVFGALNIPFAKLLQKCQSQVMIAQDKRLRSTSEILNSMKIIKLQSWEDKFRELIESYRETEFHWLAESQYKKAFGYALYWVSPTIVSSVVFFGCVLLGGSSPLDAGTVFTVLATLRTMSDPVKLIPDALSAIIQARVSFDRIESFLLDHELTGDEKPAVVPCPDSESICISIEAGNFSWDPESAVPTLKNVNMEVSRGQKVAVCGPVGAGKSSLLHAILGEIPKVSRNNVKVFGSIAYVPQSPFIQSGTIRDNILYGKPMEKSTYEKVVKACALDKDISSFDHGDLTEIGQRGLNLSGGQKQRIQLARALYNDAEIYLLDDPFSAVDAHTAATLFNDCVMGALEKKTVILVTHQVEFLSQVDKIMVIKDGEVAHSGSYKELSVAGGAVFKQLVEAHRNSIEPLDDPNALEHHNKNAEEITRPEIITRENSEDEVLLETLPGIQLTEDEERQTGSVDLKSLLDYIVIPKGSLLFSSIALSHIAFSALQVAASYWLAFGIEIPDLSSVVLIGGYTVISTSSVLFVYLRSLFAAMLGLKASKAFFSGFTNSIFKAPMLFFDSTPVGRILTRASTDFSVLDNDIHFSLGVVVAGIVEMITIITIMAYNTWQILFIAVFTTGASIYLQEYYKSSARELMRINGTTKAPVMSYASETALGVATIRAYKTADRFFMNYLKLIDTDAKVFLHSNASLEWLVLRVEGLQNLTSVTATFLLISLPKGVISPGLVGLSMSYILTLSSMQVILTRWYSNLCNYIISVERIKQFMHITPEPPAVVEDRRPPLSWPSKGRIELQDLKIKYRPNAPLVLKGITCSFQEGTRVGVVGRTGSGKTTLISALFRLVDPHSGRILIDKIDICSIGLKDLRLKLSIIPQEPSLFKGSVRTNLDPLGLYSDDDIWKVLEKCQLKDTISSLPNLLDSSVSDEGENWSTGQRQLFCLGRVLLRRNKILVLDEATASIDSATDAILQKIIRQEFSNCTVITVAHRVPTVIDSDMVMLLSFGKLVEYDAPSRLMETDSAFSKLVAEYWASCSRKTTLF